MTQPRCPFCALPDERIVWASELVVAVRDGFPVSEGHTLVIPRRHIATYFDAGAFEKAEIWRAVEAVKAELDAAHAPAGYNVGFNAGAAAGQTVMHLHVHVIPRYEGDMDDPRGGVRGVIPGRQKYGEAAGRGLRAAGERASVRGETVETGDFGQGQGQGQGQVGFAALPVFVPGEEVHFVRAVQGALAEAEQADLLVAFASHSGLDLIEDDVLDALERGATVRVLTGDYLRITSADALRRLFAMAEEHERFHAFVYATGDRSGTSFHPKAYVFRRGDEGIAYVGSSNLSRLALTAGIEWNLRLVRSDDAVSFQRIVQRFEALLADPATQPLSRAFIEAYEALAPVPVTPEMRTPPPEPHEVQRDALAALLKTRVDGNTRGLVVLATGLGKTFLAAFDCKVMEARRALFVAHRDEILTQARAAWARVFPGKVLGIMSAGRHEPNADFLFASVQTLARARHLRQFAPDHFDYVVIDEFHHAAAATYRKLLAHFRPKFLLGLTATPDRMDGASLLELCDHNLVFRRDLVHGVHRKLLVPFHYFGVKDEVDFSPIPWRSRHFDAEALTDAVATDERAAQALREYHRHAPEGTRRTLAFCCTTRHADFMADFLRSQGVRAVAVHSGPSSAPRAESLRMLASGELEVICAVDVFNEGLDVPSINTVLMLRPTESPVIFLQQLGRGLRPDDGKTHLTVVDFIGNHRSFLQKPQALVYLTGKDLTPFAALQAIREKRLELPEGCSVDIELEALDMLAALAPVSREDAVVYEYQTLRDTHGRRPTAAELFDAGVNFKPIKDRGTWFDFVAAQGDLDDAESGVLARHRTWFDDLLRTKMSKSYKMVALAGMIERDALFGHVAVADSAADAWRHVHDHLLLYRELQEDTKRQHLDAAFERAWREMPLEVWARGESTSRPWFALEGGSFVSLLEVDEADRDVFEAMTEEMVAFRLAEHLDRLRRKETLDARHAPIRLKVSHTGGRPILFLDRAARPDTPEGDVRIRVQDDGHDYLFRFVKVACNVVTDLSEPGPNALPRLMRGWFGPSAGQPGSRHYVYLQQSADGWKLTRDEADAPGEAEVIPFPSVPYYADLKVACGAFDKTDRLVEGAQPLQVVATRPLDPQRHFVVRAHGDSMDGGIAPIRDGDLVLCEWYRGAAADVAGKPVLLVGHESADTSFAAIKVPFHRDGRWVLESWNPTFATQVLPAGGRVEPYARVLEVVREADGLVLWGQYDRDAIARAFGSENNPSWRVGHRDIDVDGKPHTVLMVTLRKPADTPIEHRYADRFVSRIVFQWESQATTAPGGAKGQRIIGHVAEGRTVHLFVRYEGRTTFLYCGAVAYERHEGGEPMRVWWRLERALPEGVWRVWG